MALNTRFDTANAATVAAFTITWTTNSPSSSTGQTVADGDAVASTESGNILYNHNAQIAALIVDMASMRTAMNDGG